jgi:hypothetical protein
MFVRIGAAVRRWWQRPYWFPEMWSALVLIGFSVWSIAAPIPLADIPSFHAATRLMPQGAWEYMTGTVGMLQFGALLMDRRWLRGAAAAVATWLTGVISLGAVLSFSSPIDVFPLGFLGINIFAVLRAVGNAR